MTRWNPRGRASNWIRRCNHTALLGAVAKRAPDDRGPDPDLRPEDDREERQRQPGTQVRADPADLPVRRQVENHRIGQPNPQQPRFAVEDTPIALTDLLLPLQSPQHSLESAQAELDVL